MSKDTKDKRSFFERLTGSVEDEETTLGAGTGSRILSEEREIGWMEEENEEAQLTIDVYQTPDEIIVKSIVAGVKPDDLQINITRDMVTIKGKREENREVTDGEYFYKELYWGSFSRTVMLPQEVDPEEAEAIEKHGLLIIKLPKLDKEKQTKLKVKSI
ncbi:MAG: Hsp20/alpha crystallin family protein [Candidatus Paceibacterota bacterium]|jgi:HSP20 family protein